MLYGRYVTRCFSRRFPRTHRRGLLTLAIETSCDDTCVAILEKASPLDGDRPPTDPSVPAAQILFNKKYTAPDTGRGGIHPLEALDSHGLHLAQLIAESLNFLPDAHPGQLRAQRQLVLANGIVKQRPDFIAVTRGPGMGSNLNCGLDTAKGLAVAWQVPLVGVHHMQAHALTPRLVSATQQTQAHLQEKLPSFPFLTLLVSGGHTMLVHSRDLVDHEILATTTDVAIGNALDKCGRLLLPLEYKQNVKDTSYGKYLSQFAYPCEADFRKYIIPRTRGEEIDKTPNEFGWQIKTPLSDTKALAFSFSGITSSTRSLFEKRSTQGSMEPKENLHLARTILGTAFEHLGSRTVIALQSLRAQGVNIASLVVSGGVAANDFLRYFLRAMLDIRGFSDVQLVFPPVALCTDNAAMIAWCGMEMFEAGYSNNLGMHSLRKWSMDAESPDGGILGADG